MALKITGIKNIQKVIENTNEKAFTQAELKKIGNSVTDNMRDFISKGISPIQGKGRFPAYKNPKSYPGKKKNARPVNLELSGDFLKSLYSKGKTGINPQIEIGYPPDEALKEKGHRDGANGQKKRPTIPDGNEKFAVTIVNDLIDGMAEAVNKYFKKEKLTK